MIVLSLALILVAVALLALGLTGGSSSLLIASIVASLLAAIVLVIGARRAAALRLAAEQESLDGAPPLRGDAAAPPRRDEATVRFAPRHRTVDEQVTVADAVPGEHAEAAAYAAGRTDAEHALNDHLGAPAQPGDVRGHGSPAAGGAQSAGLADQAGLGTATTGSPDGSGLSGEPGSEPSAERGSVAPAEPGSVAPAESGPGVSAEFGEPDPEDPEDEPLPEAVRPGDAVRIAAMDAEVLVVDSRPRYHLGDCPDLADRQTEPLPVSEAIELGFTPCGLCRPVEHLVTAAVRR